MPLQGDQQALLQLLCERGQSYSDIGELLGTGPEEVRSKARAALQDLGGADPDAEVGLTDYLLGQADPIGRADAVRYLQSNPETLALAARLEDELRSIAPAASLPKLPEPRGKRRKAAVPGAGEATAGPPRTGDPTAAATSAATSVGGAESRARSRQSRLFGLIAGAGVILLLAILAIAGTFSGDDEPASGSLDATAEDATTAAAEETRRITDVELSAVEGSGVAGSAEFGVVGGSQPFVDLQVDGLDPKPPEDSTYFIWLMIGDIGGYPIPQPLTPDQNGGFSGRIAISPTVASTVATRADLVKISLSPIEELGVEAKKAAEEGEPIVPFTGTELASGKIPVVPPADGG